MRTAFTRAMMAGHPARLSSPRKAIRPGVAVPPVGEVSGVPRRERSCQRHLPEAQRLDQPDRPRVPRRGRGPAPVPPDRPEEPAHRCTRVPLPPVSEAEDVGDLRKARCMTRALYPPQVRTAFEADR